MSPSEAAGKRTFDLIMSASWAQSSPPSTSLTPEKRRPSWKTSVESVVKEPEAMPPMSDQWALLPTKATISPS